MSRNDDDSHADHDESATGHEPAAPARYEPLAERAKVAVAVLAVIIVADLVALWSGVLELRLLDRLIAGETVSDSEATSNDNRQSLVGIAQLVLYILGAVVFIRWLHRAYRNVDAVDPAERHHGTGWAIGGWFVPVLTLWRPKQIVNDVWRAATPTAHPEDRSPAYCSRCGGSRSGSGTSSARSRRASGSPTTPRRTSCAAARSPISPPTRSTSWPPCSRFSRCVR